MMSPAKWLGSTPVILISGLVMLALMIQIRLAAQQIGGDLLDFQLTGEAAIARLSELRELPQGIAVHKFISGKLDMAYPLAYGLFFASLAIRFSQTHRVIFILPMLFAAGLDIAENLTQLQGLAGNEAALNAKTVLTPLKFAMAGLGILLALWCCGRALARR
ncbi:MAG: hypothetical protein MRY64_16120 [Hyphomonadaceae bacterium]|nr:hypothetical protein [Hyphomonadaceae bacterium]